VTGGGVLYDPSKKKDYREKRITRSHLGGRRFPRRGPTRRKSVVSRASPLKRGRVGEEKSRGNKKKKKKKKLRGMKNLNFHEGRKNGPGSRKSRKNPGTDTQKGREGL